MFNLEQAISEWRQQMLAAGVKSPVPLEELESHLKEEIEGRVQSGMPEEQAFKVAINNIGQAERLKIEFRNAGFLNWFGDDKNTRINRAFALFWLIFCGWISFNIGHALISGIVLPAIAGNSTSISLGSLLAIIFEVIFVRGLIASIRVIRGKNKEIRPLHFIAVLGVATFIAQVIVFKRASLVDIGLITANVASLFLMRSLSQKDSKATQS